MSTVVEPQTIQQGAQIDIRNPRTQEVLYSISEPSEEQIAEVYNNARAFQKVVSGMSLKERVAAVEKLKRYILDHKEQIIDKIVSETGKSRTDALISEIFNTVDALDYYEKNAEKILAPQKVPTPIILMPKRSKIYYEPIGPVLIISPWNYPFNLTMIPFVCAFLAGNTVIFKPSEWTPLQGMLEKMINDSGFPKEGLQIVYGGKDTGSKLIDGRPAKIFFTGSTNSGKAVMRHAADYLIPVELELGGKDPMVVFDDVDIERTVNGAIWGGFSNCGQTCTAVERVIVHEKIYPEFVQALKAKVENLSRPSKPRTPNDPRSEDLGCMTPPFQVEKVVELIEDAVKNGAELVCGGKRVGDTHEIEPTVIANCKDDLRIIREETFGPVITVQKFKTDEEAVSIANDTPYGLSGSVWSRDTERAERIARQIETGNVSINNVLATQGNSALPFGGTKESGFGRYKGPFGLHSFSNIKSVLVDNQGSHLELNWYPYSERKYELFCQLLDAVYGKSPLKLLKAMQIGTKLKNLAKTKRL